MDPELKQLVGDDEKILYEGKPDRVCYILEGVFNPFLPFVLVWTLFAVFSEYVILNQPENVSGAIVEGSTVEIALSWIVLYLPIFLYAGAIMLTVWRQETASYIATEKAIYVSEGFLHKRCTKNRIAEFSQIDLRRGVLDQVFGVGDVIATRNRSGVDFWGNQRLSTTLSITNIPDYMEVYGLLKTLWKK